MRYTTIRGVLPCLDQKHEQGRAAGTQINHFLGRRNSPVRDGDRDAECKKFQSPTPPEVGNDVDCCSILEQGAGEFT